MLTAFDAPGMIRSSPDRQASPSAGPRTDGLARDSCSTGDAGRTKPEDMAVEGELASMDGGVTTVSARRKPCDSPREGQVGGGCRVSGQLPPRNSSAWEGGTNPVVQALQQQHRARTGSSTATVERALTSSGTRLGRKQDDQPVKYGLEVVGGLGEPKQFGPPVVGCSTGGRKFANTSVPVSAASVSSRRRLAPRMQRAPSASPA